MCERDSLGAAEEVRLDCVSIVSRTRAMVTDDHKFSSLYKDSLKFYGRGGKRSDIYSVKNESAGCDELLT